MDAKALQLASERFASKATIVAPLCTARLAQLIADRAAVVDSNDEGQIDGALNSISLSVAHVWMS